MKIPVMALLLVVTAAAAAPLRAQEPPPPDTVLTPEQRALERLRALGAVAQPDTAREAVDTVRTQRVRMDSPGMDAPARIQRDSIMTLLLGVPDYVMTEYQADSVRFQADVNRLELRGTPQVAREGAQLVADSLIVYEEAIARACGYGSPVLHVPGMQNPLVSDTVCYDVQREVGYARGARTTVAEGATWNMRGDVYFMGDDFYSHDALFTDCDLPWEHVHYAFGARHMKVVRDNVLVARNVTMRFADVPVFWMPFMVQSLSQGRRSGILMPRFGINDIARTSARYSRRIEDVGMYWAINDHLGAEVAMDWFANNWTAVRGSVDYNFNERFLRGGLTYRYFWPEEGGREFTVASQNSWQVDERTRVGLNANYSSSTRFVQQRSFDPRELNQSIDSNLSANRRFDWGTANLTSRRRQHLSDNTVDWQLPNLGLTFSPVTLFEAMPGEDRWYSNATLQGNTNLQIDGRAIGAENTNPRAQSTRTLSTGTSGGINVGRFSWNQSFDFTDLSRDERILPGDTLEIPAFAEQRGKWDSSLNFQQRLIGTSTLTPGIRLGGEFLRNDDTGEAVVHSPMRVDVSAGLRTELYGFWGGVGPFDRFRHRLSPSLTYGYSPAVRADTLQTRVFSARDRAERNTLSLGLSQTFEARYRGDARDTEAPQDTAAAGETATEPGEPGEPRRIERARTVQLLSLNTDALMYDFVRAREEGAGITTTQIGNSLRSDLLQGLELRFTHDLFRTPEGAEPGSSSREFAPHLSQVSANFSLSGDSWLFRVLRLGRGDVIRTDGAPLQEGEPSVGGPAVDRTQTEYGMVGTSRRTMAGGEPRGAVGSWRASLDYTLARPRDPLPGEFRAGGSDNQMLRGRFTFQPTENWTVNWNTGYSFGGSGFMDHVMTLTRRLHDWDANFHFVKAQNGNFSFQFAVHLRANPDIKLDYSQSDSPHMRQGERMF